MLLNSMILELCRIRKFPGQTEPTMSAEVELISTMAEKKSWTRPPIQMEFQVLNQLLCHFHIPMKWTGCIFYCFGCHNLNPMLNKHKKDRKEKSFKSPQSPQ